MIVVALLGFIVLVFLVVGAIGLLATWLERGSPGTNSAGPGYRPDPWRRGYDKGYDDAKAGRPPDPTRRSR